MKRERERERGFSLVAAIFLIVVVALIAAFMVTIGSIQRTTTAFAVAGARGHNAALGGIEWGIYQTLNDGNSPQECFAPNPAIFTISGGASGNFEVTVACVRTPSAPATMVVEGSTTYVVFDLTATAVFDPAPGDLEDFFSRTISASVIAE